MKIIMDMDEVIVDFINPLLEKYNEVHQSNLTPEDITRWELPRDVKDLFFHKGFFVELPPIPGAIEGMRALRKEHDVVIATSPSHDGDVAKEKMTWIRIWLPEYADDLIITERKDRLIGDVIVDDAVHHLARFKGQKICMDRPWNRSFDDCNRVKNWKELLEGIDYIEQQNKVNFTSAG